MELYYCRHPEILPQELIEKLTPRLSADERKRSKNFKREDARTSHAVSQVLLHELLKAKVSDFHILRTSFGKPYLRNNDKVHFNLTHSSGVCGILISNSECGIDVEAIHDRYEFSRFEKIFSSREQYTLQKFGNKLTAQFWTIKEAWAKYLGFGLSSNFLQCQVTYDEKQNSCQLSDPDRKQLCSFQFIDEGNVIASVGVCKPSVVKKIDWQNLLRAGEITSSTIS